MNGIVPSAVWALGAVSLLNDAASEMIYPLLPAFVGALGGGPAMLGLIEGVAEMIASLLKLVSGTLADRVGRLKMLTFAGYGLANLVRPLLALAPSPGVVLALRAGDRVGKGLRTAPRDALLARAAPPENRGRAFGLHRAMDHLGAIVGPAIAFSLLQAHVTMRVLFAWSALPGALCLVVLALAVREQAGEKVPRAAVGLPASPPFRRLLLAVALFTLGNSSDAFLLWRAKEVGIPLAFAPLLWIGLHAVKAASSTYGGGLSDRMGRRAVITAGWAVYGAVYLGFGFARAAWQIGALFVVYGLYFGLTEGTEKALVVDLAPADWRGRALGAYHATVGLAALPASLLFGLLYKAAGPGAAFTVGAGLAALAALALPRNPGLRKQPE